MVVATSRDTLEKKKNTQTSFQASHWRLEMVTMGYSNCKGLLVLNRIPGLWMDSNTRMALQRKPVPKRGIWSKPRNAFWQIWKIYMGEIGWAGWLCFKRGWIEDVMASSASLDLRTPTAGKWKKISKYLSHLYSQPSKIWAGLSFCTPIFDAKHNLRKLHTQTEVIQLTNVLYVYTLPPPPRMPVTTRMTWHF